MSAGEPGWIDAYLAWQVRPAHRQRKINAVARFAYPTPLWAGGMDDLPADEPHIWPGFAPTKEQKKAGMAPRDPMPRTARGYAEHLVDALDAVS